MRVGVDNDIVLKVACYGLEEELLFSNPRMPNDIAVLGSARFVVRRAIHKMTLSGSMTASIERANSLIQHFASIDPTEDEHASAAKYEIDAQRVGANLDAGEGLLCAVAVRRSVRFVITGDKRAINAIDKVSRAHRELIALRGRIMSLEQLALTSLQAGFQERLRNAICSEREIDKTLTTCFRCRTQVSDEQSFAECLRSYISTIRLKASRMLAL